MRKRIISMVLAATMIFSIFSVSLPSVVSEAKNTVYQDNELLYWRIDSGGEEQSIKIKTSNIPINFTYTKALEDTIPYDGDKSYYVDENPGSKKSYGDTLYNAGVLEKTGSGENEVLFHRNALDPNNMLKFSNWAKRKLHYFGSSTPQQFIPESDYYGKPVYVYDADAKKGIDGLPNILTETGMLDYKVKYNGNAILIPKQPITYYTDVQGDLVEVTSDSDIKLQYAVEKSSVRASQIKWILGTNTTTVRLEAEYTYTRLVPMTSGEYKEIIFKGEYVATNGESQYGTYGRTVSQDNDTSIPVYSGGELASYKNFGSYKTNAYDFISGKNIQIISNCPVVSVKETVKYYMDVECYIIDTDMVKDDGKDKNVYIKDFLMDNISVEEYRFVKNQSTFSVKYDYATGFTVKGVSRNTDLVWLNGTHVSEAATGFSGELIEWWAGQSSDHHYSTPDNLNKDIHIERYLDYGVTMHFIDVNRPVKVVTIKIPARKKAPELKFKDVDGVTTIFGFKPKTTAIRMSDTNGKYITFPAKLTSGASAVLGTPYLMAGDSDKSKYGDQSFYVYNGGEGGKGKYISVLDLFGLTDNQNFNTVRGAYIEAQNIAVKKMAPSRISALYINPQEVFNTGRSNSQESIILESGYITISDADKSNAYEYGIPGDGGIVKRWYAIKSPKRTKVKGLNDGTTIYIRKKAITTNDKSLFLPSTYIALTYDGKGVGVPNAYYMDDYYVKGNVTVSLVNDTKSDIKISGTTMKNDEVMPLQTNDVVYRNYIYKNRLAQGLSGKSVITVQAGNKEIKLNGIDDCRISLSALLLRLKSEYGNEWTTAYEKYGITSISVSIVGYDSSLITKADDQVFKKVYKVGETEYEYHPVHLLRYMMQ